MATQTLEAMAAALEASGNYRILRRLHVANSCSSRVDGAETRIGCVVDVETSGLNVASDEIIQLAIIPFRYTTKDARVVEVLHDFSGYRQPSRPISRAITELTGIDDDMVAGRRIDPKDVAAFMAQHTVDFAVAHNMKFDREFLLRRVSGSLCELPLALLAASSAVEQRGVSRARARVSRAASRLVLPKS